MLAVMISHRNLMFSTAQTFVVLKELAKLGGVRVSVDSKFSCINSLVDSSFRHAREDPCSLVGRALVSCNGSPCLHFPVICLSSYICRSSNLDPGPRPEDILQVITLLLPF